MIRRVGRAAGNIGSLVVMLMGRSSGARTGGTVLMRGGMNTRHTLGKRPRQWAERWPKQCDERKPAHPSTIPVAARMAPTKLCSKVYFRFHAIELAADKVHCQNSTLRNRPQWKPRMLACLRRQRHVQRRDVGFCEHLLERREWWMLIAVKPRNLVVRLSH